MVLKSELQQVSLWYFRIDFVAINTYNVYEEQRLRFVEKYSRDVLIGM